MKGYMSHVDSLECNKNDNSRKLNYAHIAIAHLIYFTIQFLKLQHFILIINLAL